LGIPGRNNSASPDGKTPFETVVEQHWDGVYRLLYHLSGNRHDAEDLTQEAFLRAFVRRDSFQPGTNWRAWLMRIATNAFFDLHRRRKTARTVAIEDDLARPAVVEPGAAETAELSGLLAAALARLTETQRAVFLLRSQEELSFREIADVLDTTEETARWHMLSARRALMEQLDGKI
jgi:RNA polymerase sigma-70 factor, ECF subfamily